MQFFFCIGKKNLLYKIRKYCKDDIMSATLTPDRLTAVDLTALPNDNMAALRREAIRRGISLADLVAELVNEASERLVGPQSHHVTSTDIIRGAAAANRGEYPVIDTENPEVVN
jgi:hypothetical protein